MEAELRGDMGGVAGRLFELVSANATAEGAQWLRHGWPASAAACRGAPFRVLFAGARRRLGDVPPCAVGELEPLGGFAVARRPLHLLGRVALLARAAELLPPEGLRELLLGLFQRGDTLERCSVLCALPLLPTPDDHLEVARHGTRNYVREVFEALAVDNPYPAAWFPDEDFNQLILKALFMGVPLAGVVGLEERLNDELARMVADFARERRAAGRPVPDDIRLIMKTECP